MRNITYKNIIIFLLFVIFIILNTGNVKAVLQANGNTRATYDLSDWMLNVRKMEELGGAMGLQETLNFNLTSSSESNNIDVHMQKNTEYGALVILSASSYGNLSVITDGQTTTGNATGVVMNINNEWTAASYSGNKVSTNFKNATARYKNIYDSHTVSKKGDAMSETYGWHGAEYKDYNAMAALLRSWSGSIFSYHYGGGNTGSQWIAYLGKTYGTRAVVVSGEGL